MGPNANGDARAVEAKKREIVEELEKPLSDWGNR
jgi:hypothetical protein